MMAFLIGNQLNDKFSKAPFDTIRLSKNAQVGALPSYNASDVGIIKVKLPSLPEQQKIADSLSAIDTKIEALTSRLDATREFKRGLLQKMFV